MITSALARFNFRAKWEQIEPVAEVIVQLAVRALFVFATTMMAAAACPMHLRDVVIPMVTLGSAFLSAFFYLDQEEALP